MVSKRFHLTIYRVLHEESESELKNCQILQPYAVFSNFRTLKIKHLSFRYRTIARSLTMEIERNLVQMMHTGPPEVSKASRDLILRE